MGFLCHRGELPHIRRGRAERYPLIVSIERGQPATDIVNDIESEDGCRRRRSTGGRELQALEGNQIMPSRTRSGARRLTQ